MGFAKADEGSGPRQASRLDRNLIDYCRAAGNWFAAGFSRIFSPWPAQGRCGDFF